MPGARLQVADSRNRHSGHLVRIVSQRRVSQIRPMHRMRRQPMLDSGARPLREPCCSLHLCERDVLQKRQYLAREDLRVRLLMGPLPLGCLTLAPGIGRADLPPRLRPIHRVAAIGAHPGERPSTVKRIRASTQRPHPRNRTKLAEVAASHARARLANANVPLSQQVGTAAMHCYLANLGWSADRFINFPDDAQAGARGGSVQETRLGGGP